MTQDYAAVYSCGAPILQAMSIVSFRTIRMLTSHGVSYGLWYERFAMPASFMWQVRTSQSISAFVKTVGLWDGHGVSRRERMSDKRLKFHLWLLKPKNPIIQHLATLALIQEYAKLFMTWTWVLYDKGYDFEPPLWQSHSRGWQKHQLVCSMPLAFKIRCWGCSSWKTAWLRKNIIPDLQSSLMWRAFPIKNMPQWLEEFL